jgi:hypothetical protein
MNAIGKGFSIEDEELEEEYGDEVLYAEWNPQLDLAGSSLDAENDWDNNLPADLVDADTDTFLRKMYEYQC